MVVQGPLDFNFLLGRDYVYAMKSVLSTLFQVLSFPHNGNIVSIRKLSFIGRDYTTNHLTPLNVPYMQVASSPPQVNYMQTCPMFSVTDVSEPLTIFLTSFDLDLVGDMANPSMGTFEPDFLIRSDSLDMCSFQRTVLLLMKTSWKP